MSIAIAHAVSPVVLQYAVGGGGFSPIDIPDLSLWIDFNDQSTLYQDIAATMPVTANGQDIGAAFDKSGNGHNYFGTPLEDLPTWEANSQNGLAGALGSGINQYLDGPPANTISTSGTASGFIVWNPSVAVGNQGPVWFFQGVSNDWFYPFADNNIYDGFYNSSRPLCANVPTLNVPYYTTARNNGTNFIYRLNGVQTINTVSAYVVFGTISKLFSSPNARFAGRIYECLIYDTFLDDSQVGLIETYLINKWGL